MSLPRKRSRETRLFAPGRFSKIPAFSKGARGKIFRLRALREEPAQKSASGARIPTAGFPGAAIFDGSGVFEGSQKPVNGPKRNFRFEQKPFALDSGIFGNRFFDLYFAVYRAIWRDIRVYRAIYLAIRSVAWRNASIAVRKDGHAKFRSVIHVEGRLRIAVLSKLRPWRFEHGRTYHVRIEVRGDVFSYIVDGEPLMTLRVPEFLAAREDDSFALIFWEKDDVRPISAEIRNFRVFRGNEIASKTYTNR